VFPPKVVGEGRSTVGQKSQRRRNYQERVLTNGKLPRAFEAKPKRISSIIVVKGRECRKVFGREVT